MKHVFFFSFTVKPTLLNINILHPKVSAVPSAQASPGPHAWSTLHPVCARPGPKITVSTLQTNMFYISFVSDLPVSLWFMSECMCGCWLLLVFFFGHPVPQKSSCEVREFESLFFYQLANRKRDQQIYKCPFCSFLLNSLFLTKKRSSWTEQLYWIPLKRHIAKTMAKSSMVSTTMASAPAT